MEPKKNFNDFGYPGNGSGLYLVARFIPIILSLLLCIVAIITSYFSLDKRISIIERDVEVYVKQSIKDISEIRDSLKEMKDAQAELLAKFNMLQFSATENKK